MITIWQIFGVLTPISPIYIKIWIFNMDIFLENIDLIKRKSLNCYVKN
jgi:hypothetical protein